VIAARIRGDKSVLSRILRYGFVTLPQDIGPALLIGILIAGPATNAATLTTVWKVLGKRTSAQFLFTIAVSAVGFGLLLDRLVPMVEATLPQVATYAHAHAEGGLFYQSAALELAVTGMTCNHCVESVRRAVTECTGVQNVEVSLKRGRVVVEGENLDPDRIMSAIEELGYRTSILKS